MELQDSDIEIEKLDIPTICPFDGEELELDFRGDRITLGPFPAALRRSLAFQK